MITVSIIGTAGTKKEKGLLNKEVFEKMCNRARDILAMISSDNNEIKLVSGGASWADHIIVEIGNEYKEVELFFPSEWDATTCKHHDNGKFAWYENPGRLANFDHSKFSKAMGRNTQEDFIKLKNSKFHYGNGFHSRNSDVANCDYMITFTYTKDMESYKGGTRDTWNKCKTKKIHVDMNTL